MKKLVLIICCTIIYIFPQAQVYNNGALYIQSGSTLCIEGTLVNTATAVFDNKGTTTIKGNIQNDAVLTATSGSKMVLNGASLQSITGTNALAVADIDINNSANISIGQQLTITGICNFINGSIIAASESYPVYFSGTNASVSGTSDTKHINGWCAVSGKTSFDFPVGNGSKLKNLLASNIQNTANPIYTTYKGNNNKTTNGTSYPSGMIDVSNNWWQINTTTNTADITLYSKEADDYGSAGSIRMLRVAQKGATSWNVLTTTLSGTLTNGTVTSAGVNSFGVFGIGVSAFPLAIKLIDFKGVLHNERVDLTWDITGDDEVSHYMVERSNDARTWNAIATIKTRNSSNPETYQSQDENPYQGFNYYRLKIQALDGKITYSKIIAIEVNKTSTFQILPNIITNGTLNLSNNNNHSFKGIITDMAGKIHSQVVIIKANNKFNVAGLSAGKYYLVIQNEEKTVATLPFVIE